METKKVKAFHWFQVRAESRHIFRLFLAQEIQLWRGINDACDS